MAAAFSSTEQRRRDPGLPALREHKANSLVVKGLNPLAVGTQDDALRELTPAFTHMGLSPLPTLADMRLVVTPQGLVVITAKPRLFQELLSKKKLLRTFQKQRIYLDRWESAQRQRVKFLERRMVKLEKTVRSRDEDMAQMQQKLEELHAKVDRIMSAPAIVQASLIDTPLSTPGSSNPMQVLAATAAVEQPVQQVHAPLSLQLVSPGPPQSAMAGAPEYNRPVVARPPPDHHVLRGTQTLAPGPQPPPPAHSPRAPAVRGQTPRSAAHAPLAAAAD